MTFLKKEGDIQKHKILNTKGPGVPYDNAECVLTRNGYMPAAPPEVLSLKPAVEEPGSFSFLVHSNVPDFLML